MKKNISQTLINRISTFSKNNEANNKINNENIVKSNTFYQIKQNNNKILSMNDFKSIDKNIKIPKSNPFFEKNIKNKNNNKYYKKIIFYNNNKKDSVNKTNLTKFLEEPNENIKKIYKINEYMYKSREKLPILKNSSTKNNTNSLNCSSSRLKKRNRFIFPYSKGEYKTFYNTKVNLNLEGGKINLIKKDININLPKSNSKFDYVPLGLLFKNKEKFVIQENNV